MKEWQWYSLISVAGGLVLYQLIFYIVRLSARKKRLLPELLNQHIYYPGLFLMTAIALSVGLIFVEGHLKPVFVTIIGHLLHSAVIGGLGFLAMRSLHVFKGLTIHHYKVGNPQDYTLRKVTTQFQLIQRVLNFVIGILTVGGILVSFQEVRQVGGTILASAGVVGVVVGFAAQKSIGSLFAGIQIAISQPVRIDDVVTVDNHFGMITDITLTYAILDTQDGRRLMIPINYFLENTFENWTRVSSDVVAKIRIRVDYSIPVEELRKVFLEWIAASDLWDKRASSFRVTDADATTIELRGTASTRNSDDSFDLECQMRERLITYIQEHYPEALPKSRVTIEGKLAPDVR